MKIINQPFNGQLGNHLIELLNSSNYHTLTIIVAFAKNSGVLRIKDSLDKFREQGGKVNVYVGIDLRVTSYEALTALLLYTDSLNVVHSEKSQTFHTKIYQFSGEKEGMIVVGSNNLTGGGLWTNFESSALMALDMSNSDDIEILKAQNNYIKSLSSIKGSFMPINTKSDIEELLKNGYILKEVSQQIHLSKQVENSAERKSLFGNGMPARLPKISIYNKETEADSCEALSEKKSKLLSEPSEVIWFETRKLTGGSRNILDLSMKSLVEKGETKGSLLYLDDSKFMLGGVAFFGINPTDTHIETDITFNFEGIDYFNNTIKFPKEGKTNGTWRLQIKGVSSSGMKITDAFRAKSEKNYLVEKIITFTKFKDDYYAISVFPDTQLKKFEKSSRVLAWNGSTKTAKKLGLL